MVAPKRSKEYFAESEYGVKASPRVAFGKSHLPRGGGRDQLGRPYMVRGKMYYPKEDKRYKRIGLASWYGEAFHGRLTANGEVYDMSHLTAAHPTMPLPSYARVTNMKNGSSVIVRVNDRGPYANGRLIDLSKRAAEMLDYTHSGTAQVRVEYVGRAPLEGRDDQYLMASYKPSKAAPDPSDGLPAGVMVAMNGSTPGGSIGEGAVVAFPGTLTDVVADQSEALAPVMTASVIQPEDLVLPAFGPIAPERPSPETQFALATMSYAPNQSNSASAAFDVLEGASQPWKSTASPNQPFVAAGTFADKAQAERIRAELSGFGRATIEVSQEQGAELYSISVFEDGRGSLDDLLQAAWNHGAPDAITVRD